MTVIDLHTHSKVSDGTDSPGVIPALAAAAGCSAVALTDHDSLAGLGEARAAADAAGITLVPGCEISCKASGSAGEEASAHILVYFVEQGDNRMSDELVRLRRERFDRNRALAVRLADLGYPVDYDAVVARAGSEEGVGRPHFAQELVARGHVEDIDDAFHRLLANGKPAYVPKARLTPADVAGIARDSGGVAVLAHPLSLGLEPAELERRVFELAEAGLAGIEATYGRYTREQRAGLRRMADAAGLVATGGSDYHGTFKPGLRVGTGQGDLDVDDSVLEELAARRP
jgi:predicted metal-dependent phosphoesterase TrpH